MKKVLSLVLVALFSIGLAGCDLLPEQVPDNEFPYIDGTTYLAFDVGSEEPDWTDYVTITDEEDGVIRVTDSMIDASEVDMNTEGEYEVEIYVTDSGGRTSMFVITVQIIDARAVTIELIGDEQTYVEVGSEYVEQGAIAQYEDGQQVEYIISGEVDTTTLGQYIIEYNTIERNISVYRSVTVVDTQAPVVELGEYEHMYILKDSVFTDTFYTINDNYYTEGFDMTIRGAVLTDTVGEYELSYKATDPSGNESELVYRTVTVVEGELPLFIYEGDLEQTIEFGTEYAETEVLVLLEDGVHGTVADITVDASTVGDYVLTYTYTDTSDVTYSLVKTIHIVDTVAPVITLLGEEEVTLEYGETYLDLTAVVVDNYDQDLVVTITGEVDFTTLGTYTKSYDVTDSSGNVATTVTRTIIIEDIEAPEVTLNSTSQYYVTLNGTYTEPGLEITDNYDTNGFITDIIGTVDETVEGDYEITYTVTDSSGNVSETLIRTVTVIDIELPATIVNGGAEVVLEYLETYIEEGAQVIFEYGVFDMLVAGDTVDSSTLGTYTIVYEYTDVDNNVFMVERQVSVVDTTAPVISLNGDDEVTLEVNATFNDAGAEVTDNYDTSFTLSVDDSAVDMTVLGSYIVYYNVSDSSGNVALTVERIVNVVDTTAPSITLNDNSDYKLSLGESFTEPGVVINDNYNTVEELNLIVNGTVDMNIAGTYIITYQAIDTSGNESEILTRTVEIKDYSLDYTLVLLPDGTYEITDYIGLEMDVFIPATIGGITVTSIGESVFNQSAITSVELSSSVKTIGDYAFMYTENLNQINIPEGVVYIGVLAFGYSGITQLDLPSTLLTTHIEAFTHLINCTDIFVSELNPNFTSIDGVLFSKDEQTLLAYPLGKTDTTYEVPLGTTTIGANAFGGSRNLNEVILPTTLTSIEREAFILAENLQRIWIPDSVVTIGGRAFANDFNLYIYAEATSIPNGWIPNWNSHDVGGEVPVVWGYIPTNSEYFTTASYGEGLVITGYSNLGPKDVVIPYMIDGKVVLSIGEKAFNEMGLTSVLLPNSITHIGGDAFFRNELMSVIIPDSITEIGSRAFYGNKLTSVTISNNVMTIGEWVFGGNQLTTIIIPDNVTEIEPYAFYSNKLTSVTIPDNVKIIGDNAFANNDLTSIIIPDNIISIGENAFVGNPFTNYVVSENNLYYSSIDGVLFNFDETVLIDMPIGYAGINYVIPNGVLIIGDWAFSGNQLTSITIPDSVITIGENAFQNNQLTSITIPDSVITIGEYALAGNQLTSVTIPDGVTTIGENAFYGNPFTDYIVSENNLHFSSIDGVLFNLDATVLVSMPTGNTRTSYAIPNTVITIGNNAFYFNNLTSVIIPNSVTTIGYSAFISNQLTSVIIPDSVTTIRENAFMHNQLTNVTLGNSVTTIGYSAFHDNNLTSIVIPESVTSIGNYAFYDNNITSIVIEGNSYRFNDDWEAIGFPVEQKLIVTSSDYFMIASYGDGLVITGYSDLGPKDVVIPYMILGKVVLSIGNYAFMSHQLTSVIIPNSITIIGSSAFESNQLTSVSIGNGVTVIESWAFAVNNLTSVMIPNGVSAIGDYAFLRNNLTGIAIPDSLITIGNGVFVANPMTYYNITENNEYFNVVEGVLFSEDLTILIDMPEGDTRTSYTIPDTVRTIGDYAFSRNQLENVTIPNSVITIGEYAFGENQLTSLIIPNSVTTIADTAFSWNNLTSVTILGDETRFNDQWEHIGFPVELMPIN